MGETLRKSVLIGLLEEARAEEHAFWEGLSEAERTATGSPDRWSAKDVFAHITVWKDRLADHLEAAASGREYQRVQDIQAANREVYEANRGRSWEDLWGYEEQVFARLLAVVGASTEAALDDPDRFDWTRGRPLWKNVGFTGYFHPLDHLSHLYVGRSDIDRGLELQEEVAKNMGALDAADDWQGTTLYNLACFYALNHLAEPALEKLGQALKLSPELVEWSKEDSDLDSLRDLPGYQALYEE
jgi:hypothetical protein